MEGVKWIHVAQDKGLKAGSCKVGSINGGEFLDKLSSYSRLKKYFATLCYLPVFNQLYSYCHLRVFTVLVYKAKSYGHLLLKLYTILRLLYAQGTHDFYTVSLYPINNHTLIRHVIILHKFLRQMYIIFQF